MIYNKPGTILLSLAVLIMLLLTGLIGTALAEGIEKPVGSIVTLKCDNPTKFTDGTNIPAGTKINIKAYFTQRVPEVGIPVATGACPLTIDTKSMDTGQLYAYVTANIIGRPESAQSNAIPFYLLPGLTIAPEPAVLQSLE